MPKTYLTTADRQEASRVMAMREAFARGMARIGMVRDYQMASALDVSPAVFSKQKKDGFQRMTVERFGRMARRLHMTPQELAAIFGTAQTERSA